MAFDHKKIILSQQFLAVDPRMVGKKYCSHIVIIDFGYYAILQSLYNRLRDDFQLPSLATLRRMTKNLFCYLYLILLIPVKKGA